MAPAGCVAIRRSLSVLLLICSGAGAKIIHELSASNKEELKTVFLSTEPWLVQCGNLTDSEVHPVLRAAAKNLPKDCQVGILDCSIKLPSGKNTYDRFKLDKNVSPVLVVSANGNKPIQLQPQHLVKYLPKESLFPQDIEQAFALAKAVKTLVAPKVYQLSKTEQLVSNCFKRKLCIVTFTDKPMGNDGKVLLQRVSRRYRSVTFGHVNLGRYKFSLEKKLPEKRPCMLAFRSDGAGINKTHITMKSLHAKAHKGEFTLDEATEFANSLVVGTLDMSALPKVPSLEWRKQTSKTSSSSSSSPSSSSSSSSSSRRTRRPRAPSASKGNSAGQKDKPKQKMTEAERRERERERREEMAREEEEVANFVEEVEEDEDGEEEEEEEEELEVVEMDDDIFQTVEEDD